MAIGVAYVLLGISVVIAPKRITCPSFAPASR
jgi:hypothetical protein